MFLLSKVVRTNYLYSTVWLFRETRTSVYAGSISPAKIIFCYKLIIESEFSNAERTGLPT